MATYAILPDRHGPGFNVCVVGRNGERHTMLGFKTEADAKTWIATDRRLAALRNPLRPAALKTRA